MLQCKVFLLGCGVQTRTSKLHVCDRSFYKQFPSSLLFRFEVINVLSKGDNSWKGLRGRVNASTLKSHLPPLPNSSEKEKILVCICGPNPFTAGISKYVHMCLCVCVCWMLPWQHTALLCIHTGVTMATSPLTCLHATNNN